MAEQVDVVNFELIDELGSPNLHLGPGHFMRRDLTEPAMERIWAYNIYPFIEDLLFGERDRISRYRFADVLKRFKADVIPAPALGPEEGFLGASRVDTGA